MPGPLYRILAAMASALAACGAPAAVVTVRDSAGEPAANVAIWLVPETPAAPPAVPPRADIDQVRKSFVPPVSVVRTGTVVDFPNSDNIRHQVYSFSPAKVFTLKLYSGRQAPPVTFAEPGLVVLGCNIHDRMAAWVMVVDTPWHAVTGADGSVRIDAPAGRYVLNAWHPSLESPVTREWSPAAATDALDLALDVGPLPRPETAT